MNVIFKNENFLGKAKSCVAVFSCGKKSSKLKSKLKTLPSLKSGENFSVYSTPAIKKSSAVIFEVESKKAYSTEDMRVLGAKFLKAAKALKENNLVVTTESFESLDSENAISLLKGFVEGALLLNYEMNEGKSSNKKSPSYKVEVYHKGFKELKSLKVNIKESKAMASAVHAARRLGDLPGNMMTPSILAKNAEELKSSGVKVSVWNKAKLEKEKMGCLLGVAAGSAEEPKFIIMEYKGKGASSESPTVLVGKGLTFDAGGISIKPSAKMDEMRYDMCGGAAVVGAMKFISEMQLPVHVVGLVPSTENLLGASATKPGDILTARNGKTVEVLNTDAEGRLILADALCYASELKPKQVLCTATLTGAMVVALGSSHTGFFTRNDELAESINAASKSSGENLWRMPLTDDHQSDMKGRFADLSNMSSTRGAGSATAAAFLENFCSKEVPFAHLDIAGTAWNAGSRKAYHGSNGATGVLVRSFYEFVKTNA